MLIVTTLEVILGQAPGQYSSVFGLTPYVLNNFVGENQPSSQ